MEYEGDFDATATDSAARAQALLERGVAATKAGDHDAGRALLAESEEVAAAAGLTATAIAAHINRGWTFWVQGDADAALPFYREGAERARDAGDTERLHVGLANLGVALRRLGRHDEVITAYEEYLPHLSDNPPAAIQAHLRCGAVQGEMGDLDAASGHLGEAERLADAWELREHMPAIRLNQGLIEERRGDTAAAIDLYWDALDIAREIRSEDDLANATIALAHAYDRAGDHGRADTCFSEAEGLFRTAGDTAALADALHAHGVSLQQSGLLDRAVEAWGEEASLRRELKDHAGLGEALFEHIRAVHGRQEPPEMNLMFAEAADAYRLAGNMRLVADVQYTHAQWLRGRDLDDMAYERVKGAVAAVEAVAHPVTECLARGLYAMMLAEDGEFAQADEEIEAAEAAGRASSEHSVIVGVLARRAYVSARAGRPIDDVISQLEAAYDYAVDHLPPAVGIQAIDDLATQIRESCGRQYREPLRAFVEGLKQPREARDDGADAENDSRVP
mgnify:CR=1 FL=1